MKCQLIQYNTLITIKAGTPQQTRIRGYRYRFRLTAPEELMHIASEGGIGEECSQGFGYVVNIKG